MFLRSLLALFGSLLLTGCSLMTTPLGPTEVFLFMTYPTDQLPDQVQIQVLTENDDNLSSFNLPQMPRLFSDTGQESVNLKVSPDWVGVELRFKANGMRNGERILMGEVTFELTRGSQTEVVLDLLPPGYDVDAGPVSDADAGPVSNADAGTTPDPGTDAGTSLEPSADAGTVVAPVDSDAGTGVEPTEDAGPGVSPVDDAGMPQPPAEDAGTLEPPQSDAGTVEPPTCEPCGENASCDLATLTCVCDTGFKADTSNVCVLACGDGVVDTGEQCDDGNDALNDGCTNLCAIEEGWSCIGSPSICEAGCGDGVIAGDETCDDGNPAEADGCAFCAVEAGWSCNGEPSICATTCGDNVVAGAESCDDGDLNDQDGCNSGCNTEPGWTCDGSPSACAAICGDGLRRGDEACDDGNTENGDGCSAACGVGAGWQCEGEPSVCSVICGDGVVLTSESCDDGNDDDLDGCSATCEAETGYTCSGSPSVCTSVCGDGIPAADEPCDDGDTNSGDGCSATCTVEQGWSCSVSTTTGATVCKAECGDGLIVGDEACDDTNVADGDGCSNTCELEAGWACAGEPSTCAAVCGDGSTKGDETCDDANDDSNDGCSSICQTETGWLCQGQPSDCNTQCGDGIIAGTEECDNINMSPDTLPNNNEQDGCTNDTCQIQTGWYCEGEPSDCFTDCGDGIAAGAEECDEGPNGGQAEDGFCSAQCSYNQCGNGILEGEEVCDGDEFGGLSCATYGLRDNNGTSTSLNCTSSCSVDTSDCNGSIIPSNPNNFANRLQAEVNKEVNQIIVIPSPEPQSGGLNVAFYNFSQNADSPEGAGGVIYEETMGPVYIDSDVAQDRISRTISFYVVATGMIKLPGTGNISDLTIATVSDDGIRVRLDTGDGLNTVINNWTDHGAEQDNIELDNAQGGDMYPIEIEYYQRAGGLALQLWWNAPSMGVPDWELIPAENLYTDEGRWELNSTIDVERENGLVITSADADSPVRMKAPNNGPAFRIDDTNLEGPVVLKNLVLEETRQGVKIESDSNNENYVVITDLLIEGSYNSQGNGDEFEYGILGDDGRANVIAVNNTIRAPADDFQGQAQGIYLFGDCSFVGFNFLQGNFQPAILLNVDGNTDDCDFTTAIDNNTIHLNVSGYQDAIWASGMSTYVRNNLIYKGEFDLAFYLRNMFESALGSPLQNNYVGIDDGFCSGFSCDLGDVCQNYEDGTCRNGFDNCCQDYCYSNNGGFSAGCTSAFPELNGIDSYGCVEGSNNFYWVDKGTTIDYPDVIQEWVSAVSGQFRDIGAREQGVSFMVGGSSRVCE